VPEITGIAWTYTFGKIDDAEGEVDVSDWVGFRIYVDAASGYDYFHSNGSPSDKQVKTYSLLFIAESLDNLREWAVLLDPSVTGPTGPARRASTKTVPDSEVMIGGFRVGMSLQIGDIPIPMRKLIVEGVPVEEIGSGSPPRSVELNVPVTWLTEWAKMMHNVAAMVEGTNLYGAEFDFEPVEFPSPPEMPDLLYHYTNMDGLRGILESHVLFGTNLRFLNDSSEWLHGFDLLKEWVNAVPTSDDRGKQWQEISVQFIEETVERFSAAMNIYVACLSDDGNLLNQFRRYGDLAVGFDAPDLARLHPDRERDYVFWPERYDTEASTRAVALPFLKVAAALDAEYMGHWDVSTDVLRERLQQSKALQWFMRQMAFWCAQIKHSGFRQEQEWRAIRFTPSDADSEVRYREGRPFVKFDVSDPTAAPRCALIKHIICGPPNADEKVPLVVATLNELGYGDSGIEVVASDIPFTAS
jgi:hypothetical protein